MVMLATVIKTLIERGNYVELRDMHDIIRIAGAHTTVRQDDVDHYHILCCCLNYAQKFGRYPSFPELEQFIQGPNVGTNGQSRDSWGLKTKELADTPDMGWVYSGSWPQLLDEFTQHGRMCMYLNALYMMKSMLGGSAVDLPGIKVTPETTATELIPLALKYFDGVRRKDFTLPSSVPEGAWRENAELGAEVLLESLKDTLKDRAYTGFSRIDSTTVIGPKQSIRYIGILGFSNHGKSMFMRSMAYNMAKSGKKILYIACEDTALNTWTQLSFLHSYTQTDLDIPPINVWRNQPQSVTERQQEDLRLLIDDLQHGGSVAGEIVVRTLPRWADIQQELETGLNGKPYDVLMVDYLSHLDTGASGTKIHDEIKVLFKKAQALAIDYKAGRGLVVVTPLQAGKKPMQEADSAEGEDWGVYNDLGAVDYYTDACRDMDLVIGLWHKGDLKTQSMMKVSCLKSREEPFETHFLTIDRRTRMVMDLAEVPTAHKMSMYRDPVLQEMWPIYEASLNGADLSTWTGD